MASWTGGSWGPTPSPTRSQSRPSRPPYGTSATLIAPHGARLAPSHAWPAASAGLVPCARPARAAP
eukprot:5445280-Lingulodinium_polyedra.AAC.1